MSNDELDLKKLENIPTYVSKYSWELEKIREAIGNDTLLISIIKKLPENAYIYYENTILIIDVLKQNNFPMNLLGEISERAFREPNNTIKIINELIDKKMPLEYLCKLPYYVFHFPNEYVSLAKILERKGMPIEILKKLPIPNEMLSYEWNSVRKKDYGIFENNSNREKIIEYLTDKFYLNNPVTKKISENFLKDLSINELQVINGLYTYYYKYILNAFELKYLFNDDELLLSLPDTAFEFPDRTKSLKDALEKRNVPINVLSNFSKGVFVWNNQALTLINNLDDKFLHLLPDFPEEAWAHASDFLSILSHLNVDQVPMIYDLSDTAYLYIENVIELIDFFNQKQLPINLICYLDETELSDLTDVFYFFNKVNDPNILCNISKDAFLSLEFTIELVDGLEERGLPFEILCKFYDNAFSQPGSSLLEIIDDLKNRFPNINITDWPSKVFRVGINIDNLEYLLKEANFDISKVDEFPDKILFSYENLSKRSANENSKYKNHQLRRLLTYKRSLAEQAKASKRNGESSKKKQ